MRRCWQSCDFTFAQEGRQGVNGLLRSWKLALDADWPPNASDDRGKRFPAHREQNNREASVVSGGFSTNYGSFDPIGRIAQSQQTVDWVAYTFNSYAYDKAGN